MIIASLWHGEKERNDLSLICNLFIYTLIIIPSPPKTKHKWENQELNLVSILRRDDISVNAYTRFGEKFSESSELLVGRHGSVTGLSDFRRRLNFDGTAIPHGKSGEVPGISETLGRWFKSTKKWVRERKEAKVAWGWGWRSRKREGWWWKQESLHCRRWQWTHNSEDSTRIQVRGKELWPLLSESKFNWWLQLQISQRDDKKSYYEIASKMDPFVIVNHIAAQF